MAALFREFLEDLKSFSGFEKTLAIDAERLLREVDTGIKGVDEAIKSLPVAKSEQGFLIMGERPVGEINKVLREADLAELVRISKKDIPITSSDKSLFKATVNDTPELKFREVSDLANASKAKYPHLDVTVENIENLSKAGQRDLKIAENNLFKYFKRGTIISLTIGTIVVGVDWLAKATEKRKGCFMLTTINHKTTSCKVQAYSCVGQGGDMCPQNLKLYNVTLVLMKIATLDDTDSRKISVAKAAGVAVGDLEKNLSQVIDKKYDAIAKVIREMGADRPEFAICDIRHNDVENGVVPACRMCTPSANPISTQFIDPTQYPDNITFQCSINPSLIDTISDAVINTGKNLWDGITNGILQFLKPIAIFIVVILSLFIVVSIVLKFIPNRSAKSSTIIQQLPSTNVTRQYYQ